MCTGARHIGSIPFLSDKTALTAAPSPVPPMIPTESPATAIPRSPGAPPCPDSRICMSRTIIEIPVVDDVITAVDVEVKREAPEVSMVMSRGAGASEM